MRTDAPAPRGDGLDPAVRPAWPGRAADRPAGFTLVELLVAIAILLMVTTVVYAIFAAVTKAWQRGTALSEDLHHADFAIEQLCMGLRSAVYRDRSDGFWLQDNGDGPASSDIISWVKTGPALVGEEAEVAKSIHRVEFSVRKDETSGKPGAAVTAWGGEYMQPEDFDPSQLPPVFLSSHITGFNCRVATNVVNDAIDWQDTWEGDLGLRGNLTNHVPQYVEITLYLEPLAPGEDAVTVKRCVEIPIALASWK
jgi:prepilin-type N-terminal cleavage/methylation domain-containing protein